jgi:prepilin-type N-terminal cleavage/methylation domain-containing protein
MKVYKRAFTLVELIIVISIVALLSTIGITTYSSVQKDARNIRRKSDLKEMKTALEAYKAKNGNYPSTIARVGCPGQTAVNPGWCGICSTYGSFSDTDSAPADPLVDTTGYIPNLAPEFIPKLPRDPRESKANTSSDNTGAGSCAVSPGSNCYLYRSNGDDYKLLAHCSPEGHLSNTDAYFDSARYCGATGSATCAAGGGWAWQVSSSNLSIAW